jgi:hypothetical protein
VKTEDHIKRYLSDPDGLDFDGLRRKGIALLQDLSSHAWTDYNLHDPGVMLLELLSYGLTDLVYRTDFDVADFLTGPSGQIDFQQQALFPPQEIFPNQPVTDVDFCKLIYDRRPKVDDVWIRPGSLPGLFKVYVKPHTSLVSAGEAVEFNAPAKGVLELLQQHRNLCRDIEAVRVVATQPHTLGGEIEIDDSRPAAEVCAEIYFRCAKEISSDGQIVRFEEARAQGMSWEQILDGPLTSHGYIADKHFKDENYQIDMARLVRLVRHIPGVRQVKRLYLLDQTRKEKTEHKWLPEAGTLCPVLLFPQDPELTGKLQLVHGQSVPRQHAASHAAQFHEQVKLYLRKLEFEHAAFRSNDGKLAQLIKLPQGQYRPLAEYGSVGEHTPAIYGINRYGVPDSDPTEVHARAAQLKAYLYPFEQLMANYLASLQHLKHLYSPDPRLDRSYFAQYLDDAQVPKLPELYRDGMEQSEVHAVLAGLDGFNDRRNRVLDSLLAVYGEVFPDHMLKRYDLYHADDFGQHLIACKIGMLRHLCDLSGRRGQAMNVQWQPGNGISQATIQRRVQLLCGGSEAVLGRYLLAVPKDQQLRFLSDERYERQLAQPEGYADVPAKPLGWPQLPGDGVAPGAQYELPQGALSGLLLQAGVHKDNYHVLANDGDEQGWLCLHVDDKRHWPLLRLPMAELLPAASALRERLISLNKNMEGFHLLEHVLLRPRSGAQCKVGPEFYAHRVSVVLPSFTARFSDPGCRAWIEEMISQNLPAHVLPDFYWLKVSDLALFEKLYKDWLDALAGEDMAKIDEQADKLIFSLERVEKSRSDRPWM